MIYGDLHCDTLWRCFERRVDLSDPLLQLKRDPPFSHLQTYAIYIPDTVDDPYRYFRTVYAYGQEMMRRFPNMVHCKTAVEIDKAFAAGKTPYLFSIEGGSFFGPDPEKNRRTAKELKEKGIAFLSLCYNRGNGLAGGNLSPERGLSSLGKEVALILREEGISLDLSHLNHRSADALLELLPDGVVATHSNCFSLAPHPRNLTDEQIKALIEKNGLIGINFYPPFLTAEEEASVEDVRLHIRHIERLGGQKVLAFGSDFDGIEHTPKDLTNLWAVQKLFDLGESYLYGNMKRYLDTYFK
ncbi:MAG: membrane dipeptidase [Clostridia bacterium]|nr:membrane dipeptidase [Clostridia bacterium]